MKIEIRFLDADLAGFDLGNIQHILDQLEHRPRGFVHRLHHFGLFRVQRRIAQQVVHPDDGVERRAHLVAHRGEETSLRLVRGFLATQRIEQAGDELALEQRQQDHAYHETDAEHAVLYPVIAERQDQGEAHDAEDERVVQIRLAVTEPVAERDHQISDVKHCAVFAQVIHEGRGRADVEKCSENTARRRCHREEIDPPEYRAAQREVADHCGEQQQIGFAAAKGLREEVQEQYYCDQQPNDRLLVFGVRAPAEAGANSCQDRFQRHRAPSRVTAPAGRQTVRRWKGLPLGSAP